MNHPLWHQYLEVGETLASQSELFPVVVAFLGALVDSDESRQLIVRFLESQLADLTTPTYRRCPVSRRAPTDRTGG